MKGFDQFPTNERAAFERLKQVVGEKASQFDGKHLFELRKPQRKLVKLHWQYQKRFGKNYWILPGEVSN